MTMIIKKPSLQLWLLLPVFLPLIASANVGPTIPNPSFEADTFIVFPGYASGNGGGITGWTLSDASRIGLNPASGSPFADVGTIPNGVNVGFIQAISGTTNTLSTTIIDLTPGVTYKVSFRANHRSVYEIGTATWSLNGLPFVPFTASPAVVGEYYANSGIFTATNTTAALVLKNGIASGDTTVVVDDFSIAPEPIVVSNSNDSGPGSLRQRLQDAASYGGTNTITFAPALSGATITLFGEIGISNHVTIDAGSLSGGLTLSGNDANRIFYINANKTVSLLGLTFSHGRDSGAQGGGAINNQGTLSMSQCTLSQNSALFGGAIFNQIKIALVQCALIGNRANAGGALYSNGAMAMTNCTVSGNVANDSGGAITTILFTSILTHCTIAGNSATNRGGGVYCDIGVTPTDLRLFDTIIARNAANLAPDVWASFAPTAIGNIIGDGAHSGIPHGVNGNLVGTNTSPIDPQLAPLGYHGGPTQTMPPLPGSPAIDTAVDAGLTTDQRGFPRPLDGDANTNAAPDIGAVEFKITPPVAGTYSGLFYESGGVTHGRSGFFTASITTLRKFSARLNLAGKSYSFSGKFDATGASSNSIPRRGLSPLTVKLYSLATNELFGSVTDGSWKADLFADRAVFNKLSNPAPQAARYTMYIPGGENPTNTPVGDGFGTVTVDTAGKVTLKGTLADGTAIAQSTTVSRNGEWPLYVAVNSGKGSILSWVAFYNDTPKIFSGDLMWTKLPDALAKYYPAGFIHDTSIYGSQYTPPPTGTRILTDTNLYANFLGGNFAATNNVTFTLGANNKISNPSDAKFTLRFTTSTGLFSGSVTDPVTLKAVLFKGAVDQAHALCNGFFLELNQSGLVIINGH